MNPCHEPLQAALRTTAENIARLFDCAPTAKFLSALEDFPRGRGNPAFLRLIHQPAATAADAFSLADVLDSRGKEACRMQTELRDTRMLAPREVEIDLVDGGSGLCSVSGECVSLHGREHILLTFHDLSERRRRELELRESEQRFRQLAETIKEVFWIADPRRLQILYVSPAYEKIFGRDPAQLVLRAFDWMEAIHPTDRPRVEAAVTRLLDGETYDEVFRVQGPHGSVRWVRDRAFPVYDAAGTLYRIVGMAADITQQKNLEAQVVRSQRFEAVGTVAAGVAHDLNNILTPILMATGALLQGPLDQNDRELIAMIESAASRGADLAKQLLAVSRRREGKPVQIQVPALLREIDLLVTSSFPPEIAARFDASEDVWPIEVDSTQLHQVLLNLCINARDAMPEGGVLQVHAKNDTLAAGDPRLDAKAAPGRYVVFSVSDTGTGIVPEVLPHIFDPFFTTKADDRGTGLGLSTVLEIVKSHQGFMEVKSIVGQGTIFRIYWPACGG